jgi:hypothetical protein
MMKVWTREHLNKIFDAAEQGHDKAREQVCFFLMAVYANQTADEQETNTTTESNGQGFNAQDASFGTSLAERFIKGIPFTEKQMASLIKMLRKYSRQILEKANMLEELKQTDEGQRMHNVNDDPLHQPHYVPYWQIVRDNIRGGGY